MSTVPAFNALDARQDVCPHFKVILMGEAGVGKTALFLRIRDNVFHNKSQPSIAADGCVVSRMVNGEKIILHIWDTSGFEKFKTVTRNYYRHAHASILVYDVNNPASLHYLSKWAADCMDFAPGALRVLLGNKSDLEKNVLTDSVDNFEYAHSCCFSCTTSAKTGAGVEDLLTRLGVLLLGTIKTPLFYGHSCDSPITLQDGDAGQHANQSMFTNCC